MLDFFPICLNEHHTAFCFCYKNKVEKQLNLAFFSRANDLKTNQKQNCLCSWTMCRRLACPRRSHHVRGGAVPNPLADSSTSSARRHCRPPAASSGASIAWLAIQFSRGFNVSDLSIVFFLSATATLFSFTLFFTVHVAGQVIAVPNGCTRARPHIKLCHNVDTWSAAPGSGAGVSSVREKCY